VVVFFAGMQEPIAFWDQYMSVFNQTSIHFAVVLASLVPILWESGIGSDVMKPIAAPIVGGMITSTIHVLILVPVFFELIQKRALRRGTASHG
jgi:Cu/Ag efflux pump CusA